MIKRFKKGVNEKLTENFDSTEFDCNCTECSATYIDLDHVSRLQKLRNMVGPLFITSGYRCEDHNKKVGGVKNSQHLLGTATDIVPGDNSVKAAYAFALSLEFKGIGLYKDFIHLDNRKSKKARWGA